jgi:hypothetical protein
LSRNLTFDRSWDTILMLEGAVKEGLAYQNGPLCDFLLALPKFSKRQPDSSIHQRLELFVEELARVEFPVDRPFEQLSFVPLGINEGSEWPFPGRPEAALVISPFIRADFLSRLTVAKPKAALVARNEELDACDPMILQRFEQIFTLNPHAESESETDEDNELRGLHAKAFMLEHGLQTSLWIGSANATMAAMRRNVEILVRLDAPRQSLVIDDILAPGREKEITLETILEPYSPPDEVQGPSEEERQAEQKVRRARNAISDALWEADVLTLSDKDNKESEYELLLATDCPKLTSVSVRIWPISVASERAKEFVGGELKFGPLSFSALTAFFGCKVTTVDDLWSESFVLFAPLKNPPADRSGRVMSELLRDQSRLLRYLLLLLAADDAFEHLREALLASPKSGESGNGSGLGLPSNLFESLVRALAGEGAQLEHVNRLVEDLERSDNTHLLPAGFAAIWEPVWETYQRQRQARGQFARTG